MKGDDLPQSHREHREFVAWHLHEVRANLIGLCGLSAVCHMKITVLAYVEEGSSHFDAVVTQIASAQRQPSHLVSVLGVFNDPNKLINRLRRQKPKLVATST